MKRRKFLKSGTQTGAGIMMMLSTGNVAKSEDAAAIASGSLTPGDREVLQILGGFAAQAYIHGACIARPASAAGTTRVLDLLAKLDTPDAFVAYQIQNGSLPFERISVRENFFVFEHEDTFYQIEMLPADDFHQRVAEFESGDEWEYTVDALCFHPASGSVSDKYQALGSAALQPRPQATAGSTTARFTRVLEGQCSIGYHGLAASRGFANFRRDTLAGAPGDREEADRIVEALLQHVVCLAESNSNPVVREVLQSNLVSSSLLIVDGRSTSDLVAAFPRIRDRSEASIPSGAVWLAILIGSPEDGNAYAHRALRSQKALASRKTSEALGQALAILRDEGTARLIPAVSAGVAAHNFEAWIGDVGGAASGTDLSCAGDIDGDGVPDLVEYGLGMDPATASLAGLPRRGVETHNGETWLTLSYQRDLTKTDIAYQVQYARLPGEAWTSEGVLEKADGPLSLDGLQPWKGRVPLEGTRGFLRLKIERHSDHPGN